MFKYAKKNLLRLIVHDKLILFLAMLCVAASVIITHFSYGLYQNYHVLITEHENDVIWFSVMINKPEMVTKDKLISCVKSIPEKTAKKICNFNSVANLQFEWESPFDENGSSLDMMDPVRCFFDIEDGQIVSSKYFRNVHEKEGTLTGMYFTDEMYASGQKYALMDQVFMKSKKAKEELRIPDPEAPMGYAISLQGERYSVIGSIDARNMAVVPITALHDDTEFRSYIGINFGDENELRPINKKEYEDLKETFLNAFGDAVEVPDLEIPDNELIYLYRTIMLISVVIAAIAAFNFTQLYLYLLEKRRRRIAIMRICGCTKAKAAGIFLSECMMLILPVYLLSLLLFQKIILPSFSEKYQYMEEAYSASIYVILFLIYFGISIIELTVMIIRFLSGNNLIERQNGAVK